MLISCRPSAEDYYEKGNAYFSKEDYAAAIDNYNKAINFSDQLYIYISDINETLFNELRFELRNLEGKQIKEFYGKRSGGISYIMDVDNIPSGMYVLTLSGDGKLLQSEKIIIKH